MMSPVLLKLFATALTLSQVVVQPASVKTYFDPERDRQEVSGLLNAGCAHMTRMFGIEDIDLDDLISTAMMDPEGMTAGAPALHGLEFGDLHKAYKQFCKNEEVEGSPVELGEVIDYFNKSVADLPDHRKLKGMRLPEASFVLDVSGQPFTEVYQGDNRRIWTPLEDIPIHVRDAFVAAEDKRFFEHQGVDERGLIRAFMSNLKASGRPQGGSTITQQLAKNLLVGDDLTYDRKMREMIVAARLETALTKNDILELYLNHVFMGRASWGVEMAARSYFGKAAKSLGIAEGAFLAALTKGPNYYDPDRHWERVHERLSYVLDRMREDGYISPEEMKAAQAERLSFTAFKPPRGRGGFYFVDQIGREAKGLAGVGALAGAGYTVRSTLHPRLQSATEAALQEGLARYELNAGRFALVAPEKNLGEAIRELGATGSVAIPAWRQALASAKLPLYDVHWPAAVVLEKRRDKKGGELVRVGLADGRTMTLTTRSAAAAQRLAVHDVVHVRVVEAKGKAAWAELRGRPEAQGAAVVLENRTGRILAMTGGFSYALSQLNRASQVERQPGSTLKPLTYLAALTRGLQPNTLVWDAPVALPPIGGGRDAHVWRPKNYDGHSSAPVTLRHALEQSKNYVTARLLDGAFSDTPEESLDHLCDMAKEMEIYASCVRYYPFVLGAQPVRLVSMAAFYATIANEGFRPTPHVIESVEQGGRAVYRRPAGRPMEMASIDRVAAYQMKTFLQGVLERGTARRMRALSPYVGGKTGTTDGENDAWFVGFTNEVTIAVWVGYDNAKSRRTLGRGFTGGKVAVPIFQDIVEAVWQDYAPRTVLGPSREVERQIASLPIDLQTGDRYGSYPWSSDPESAFREHFRLQGWTRSLADTQYKLVPREQAYEVARRREAEQDGEDWGFDLPPFWRRDDQDRLARRRMAQPRAPERYVEPPIADGEDRGRRPRRVDPDYFWRRIY